MLLGSLLDAGLALGDLQADLAQLKVGGYRLAAERVTRQGLTGTHLRVIEESGERPARTLPAIEEIVGGSDLAEQVKDRSLAVFGRIARAEAAIHGTTVDHIHFHEIGAVDSLVDIRSRRPPPWPCWRRSRHPRCPVRGRVNCSLPPARRC